MAARLRHPAAPLVLLAVVSLLSFGLRIAWIDDPCRAPCTTAADHTLVFDEIYYVNAARVIAGLQPPAGAPYAGSPAGVDPNSEHPQLAKLVIAGAIELFGDGPFAWRIGSILLGSIAILGMFALVRAAGGNRWIAVAAAALMASDNLVLVHGRIGTLDIYVLAAMVWGVALYLRGRPTWGGVVLGVGACTKLVAPYALLVLVLVEAYRAWSGATTPKAGARRLSACAAAGVAVFFALLELLGWIAPPYDPNAQRKIGGGAFGHLGHMLSYAAKQTSPHGPQGIASYPWEWLGDYKPIVYLNIDPAHPSRGLRHIHPAVHFLGMISPPIMLAAVPGVVLAGWSLWRGRAVRRSPEPAPPAGSRVGLPLLAVAWFVGTWLPFELLNAIDQRTSYLYYMVIVMPGLYVAAIELFARWRPRRWIVVGWAVLVVLALIGMYPLAPIP
jgi:4-amino-4-deoxy-L-arabinose transferase-like glycosyltransferase